MIRKLAEQAQMPEGVVDASLPSHSKSVHKKISESDVLAHWAGPMITLGR
jgi:hypothetical protein